MHMYLRMPFKITIILFSLAFMICGGVVKGQKIVLMDYNDGLKQVNDGIISITTNDIETLELSAHLKIKNNSDKPIGMFMRKIYNQLVDSTSDYFCLNPKCWPDTDTTNIADSIQPGLCDSSFVTHYDHFFRYEKPIPAGFTSITYVFYDNTTFPEPTEARVTVNYFVSGVGYAEKEAAAVRIYPQPAADFLKADLSNWQSQRIKAMDLIDIQGNRVQIPSFDEQGPVVSLDTSTLPSGLYFLVITPENGARRFSKVMISR